MDIRARLLNWLHKGDGRLYHLFLRDICAVHEFYWVHVLNIFSNNVPRWILRRLDESEVHAMRSRDVRHTCWKAKFRRDVRELPDR